VEPDSGSEEEGGNNNINNYYGFMFEPHFDYTDGDEEEEVDYENHEEDEEHISEEGEVEFPEIEGIPIFPGSSITKDELLSLVLAFKLRHILESVYQIY